MVLFVFWLHLIFNCIILCVSGVFCFDREILQGISGCKSTKLWFPVQRTHSATDAQILSILQSSNVN